MRYLPRLIAAAPVMVTTALGLAACSGNGGSATAAPVYGGTLRVAAGTGPDHIDPVPAYYAADYVLERAFTRQLVSYPTVPASSTSGPAWARATTPVADAATTVPTVANGGISEGGRTYTFHIRPGVRWDSVPPRQVTSQDFLREFKAFFNPVSPARNPAYYTATISGMLAYSQAETAWFAARSHPPTAAGIAAFQDSHAISGIATPDSATIVFHLIRPATDFISMLAMPFASARPAEYDHYLPDSAALDQHTLSDGPYRISGYDPGRSVTLTRNPAWRQSTDPLRHGYVSRIVVSLGVLSAQAQLSQLRSGVADVPLLDVQLGPASVPGLIARHPPGFHIWPWPNLVPYLVFNLRSPDAKGAMSKLAVRQAIEYGVSKLAVQQVWGGPKVSRILSTVIPPGNAGAVTANPYPDHNGLGDPARCIEDLTRAGYPHGLTLTYMYPLDSADAETFTSIQASLGRCGISLTGKPEPAASFLTDLGDAPASSHPGAWDLGQPSWIPDWFGNDGRTVIQALFAGPDCVQNTVNYGCYDSPAVNSLITRAETAATATAAAGYWRQANLQVMKDAVIVPLQDQDEPLYTSTRVHEAGAATPVFNPNIGGVDLTNLWLTGP